MRFLGLGTSGLKGRLYSRLPSTIQRFGDSWRREEVGALRAPILAGIQDVSPADGQPICTCGQHNMHDSQEKQISGIHLVIAWNPLNGVRASTVTRVFQTARRIASHCPSFRVSTCAVQSRQFQDLRGAIIILHKNCISEIQILRKLKSRGNLLIVDWIDGAHLEHVNSEADGFLCSAASEYFQVRTRLSGRQRAWLVPHGVDDRLLSVQTDKVRREFKCWYFGLERNCLYAQQLRQAGLLTVVETESASAEISVESSSWVSRLGEAQIQYIARPSEQVQFGRFKPFTKGFLAAQLDQIVIGARFDFENRYWLGDDYPFYIEEETMEATKAAIIECRRAWEIGEIADARATMSRLRRLSCPAQNALDYRDALSSFAR